MQLENQQEKVADTVRESITPQKNKKLKKNAARPALYDAGGT